MSNISICFGDLVEAKFVVRPNRFVVHCSLVETNQLVEAHLADPGRLKELLIPGTSLYLRYSNNPKRKTKWSVILAKAPGSNVLVSLQSLLVNQLTTLALEQNALAELNGWQLKRPEYTLGGSRWDFLLENHNGDEMLLEVKSCGLVVQGRAMFPDAVTARGRRHVQELGELNKDGKYKAAVLFVIQRNDANEFGPADHIDPEFGQALREASQRGVQILAYDTEVSLGGIRWGRAIPIELG